MRLSLDPPPSRDRPFARDAARPVSGAAPRAAVVVASAAILALAAGCNRTVEAPPAEVRPVRTVTIEKRSAGDTVSLTGTVQAQKEVNLSFRIDGRMIGREVGVGDAVRQGQAIARLDSQNEESNLQAARAQLAAARARLAEARNNHERFRDLVAENAVSRASFEQAESALKAAESQVESAVTQVTLAENRLSYTRLVSEVAGVVTMVGAEPGEIVGPGRMIVQVAREGARDAVFDVPARVHDLASANSRISVALTSDPKVVVAGSVREVAPARRSGHRHLPREGAPGESSAGDAPRRHGDRPPVARGGAGHRDPALGGHADRQAGRPCSSSIARPAPCRRAPSRSARPIRTGSRSAPGSPRATSWSRPACRRCGRARRCAWLEGRK